MVEKGAIFIDHFPLYTPVRANVRRRDQFLLVRLSKGRVHDAALKYLAEEMEEEIQESLVASRR